MKRLVLVGLVAGVLATAVPGAAHAAPAPPQATPICTLLMELADVINRVPGLYVDPGSGDTYVLGDLFFDCPPYEPDPGPSGQPVCEALKALAPVINRVPGLQTDPTTGDTYVDGQLFVDCPPYGR